MNIPKNLTIIGGCISSHGFVSLVAMDDQSNRVSISWLENETTLSAGGHAVARHTVEEAKWVEVISAAAINGANNEMNEALAQLRENILSRVTGIYRINNEKVFGPSLEWINKIRSDADE